MARLKEILMPNNVLYDLAVNGNNVLPVMSKTFENVIGTDETDNDATLYFGHIIPISYNAAWTIKYRIRITVNGTDSVQFSQCEINGVQNKYMNYRTHNSVSDTSVRPMYYHVIYTATQAGISDGYGHLLGINLNGAYNPATAADARTVTVEIMETVNCNFEFFNSMLLYANVSGTGSTNFATKTQFNGYTQGNSMTGDRNDNYYDRIYHTRDITAGAVGVFRYTLFMEDGNGKHQSIVGSSGTETSKSRNTNGFRPGNIYYMASTAISANATGTGKSVYTQHGIDIRYSINYTSLDANKPLYLVGTMSNGLFYLDTTWWTQDLPTTADGKVYIFVGIVKSGYTVYLLTEHPMYAYIDGAVRLVTDYALNANIDITSYTEKQTPADADAVLIHDTTGSAKKKTFFSGIYSWLQNKIHALTASTTAWAASTDKLLVDRDGTLARIDYSILAKAIVETYKKGYWIYPNKSNSITEAFTMIRNSLYECSEWNLEIFSYSDLDNVKAFQQGMALIYAAASPTGRDFLGPFISYGSDKNTSMWTWVFEILDPGSGEKYLNYNIRGQWQGWKKFTMTAV